jgi:hypothetical protein
MQVMSLISRKLEVQYRMYLRNTVRDFLVAEGHGFRAPEKTHMDPSVKEF